MNSTACRSASNFALPCFALHCFSARWFHSFVACSCQTARHQSGPSPSPPITRPQTSPPRLLTSPPASPFGIFRQGYIRPTGTGKGEGEIETQSADHSRWALASILKPRAANSMQSSSHYSSLQSIEDGRDGTLDL